MKVKVDNPNFNFSQIPKGHYKVKVILINGDKKEMRVQIEDPHSLFLFSKGSHTRGWRLHSARDMKQRFKSLEFNVKDNLSASQDYLNEVNKYVKYYKKYCHPKLWAEIREKINDYEMNGNIEGFLKDPEIQSYYNAWNKAPDYHILQIERHKTMTLKTAGFKDYQIKQLKEALDKGINFSAYTRKNYDASVSIENGRGFLSLEYKGLGNGHYYLLLDENHALFSEDD